MKLSKRWIGLLVVVLATAWVQADPGDPVGDPNDGLRGELRRHFQNRLRSVLGLTDAQADELWPRVEQLENARRTARQRRAALNRELRTAYHAGGSDERLRGLLDDIARVEGESQSAERALQREIDAVLTVRQRVEMRFFTARFREELRQRLDSARRGDRSRSPERGQRRFPMRNRP